MKRKINIYVAAKLASDEAKSSIHREQKDLIHTLFLKVSHLVTRSQAVGFFYHHLLFCFQLDCLWPDWFQAPPLPQFWVIFCPSSSIVLIPGTSLLYSVPMATGPHFRMEPCLYQVAGITNHCHLFFPEVCPTLFFLLLNGQLRNWKKLMELHAG